MHRAARRDEMGFTLVELLVVMITIGILAAIAIPQFLSQRAKAHDTSTQSDMTNLGKEIATYFVDGRNVVNLDFSVPGRVILSDGFGYAASVHLTNGTATPVSGGSLNLGSPTGWCVALTDTSGAVATYRFSAANGLEQGIC